MSEISVRCWIPETQVRTFLETLVRATGVGHLGLRPPRGAVWLAEGKLEEDCWVAIRGLLDKTGTLTKTWMGVSWQSQNEDEIHCEMQRDIGYDGVRFRIEVNPELTELIRRKSAEFGGGVGLT